jgi:hypothetical protein
MRMEYMVRLHFPSSNNIVEYEARINGLRIAVELGIRHLKIRGDSELVVDQVMKEKNCVDPKMAAYLGCTQVGGQVPWARASSCTAHLQQGRIRPRQHCIKLQAGATWRVHERPHAPSVRAEGEHPQEQEGSEVMETNQSPEQNLEDPDW